MTGNNDEIYFPYELRAKAESILLAGKLGNLTTNIIDRWLIDIRETNPAIIDMFQSTDLKPYRYLLAWSGEFAGKYLTCSSQLYNMSKNERLRNYLVKFVTELISCQKSNGYLGPFPTDHQLTGTVEPAGYCFDSNFKAQSFNTWDSWGHYHIMLGLMYWYEVAGDVAALSCVLRIAELFCSKFYGEGKPRLHSIGSDEMNLAPVHSFAKLYRITGTRRYLDFALEIVKDFEIPPAGDYLRQAMDCVEFYKMPKPRWESLHSIQGIIELYKITNDEKYKKSACHIWNSITKTDIHNTGGFTTNEQATGSPYDEGAIETCCTIAYMALTADILELTNDSIAADMLEISTFNSGIGSFSPSGRWSTYDTPMSGYKRANYDSIHFQCRPGSPDLNCCSVNAPRALSLLDDWACHVYGQELSVNYYGANKSSFLLEGNKVSLVQITDYPYDGLIRIKIECNEKIPMILKLRIPFWSHNYKFRINGEDITTCSVTDKGYIVKNKVWNDGDEIELKLDMSLHIWAGEERLEGFGSIYRGPLLLCYDPFYDRKNDIMNLPVVDAESLVLKSINTSDVPGALFEFDDYILCDLFSAGTTGTPYTTWLPIKGLTPVEFSLKNPLRSKNYCMEV